MPRTGVAHDSKQSANVVADSSAEAITVNDKRLAAVRLFARISFGSHWLVPDKPRPSQCTGPKGYQVVAEDVSCWLVILLTASMLIGGAAAAEREIPPVSTRTVVYHPLETICPETINRDLKGTVPTVDIAIYLGETEGDPHGYVTAPDELVQSFQRAKKIFADAGVQLRLLWVKRAVVHASWLAVQANDVTGSAAPPEINAYVGFRSARWKLTAEATNVFGSIIEPHSENHRTIYLLYLKQVRMAYYDRTVKDRPQMKSIPTGGLSLPAYLFETRIPRRIRGVITLCQQRGNGGRTIAHELGHKLINVSHEYRQISPQFEVRGEGGLMLYGGGTEIPAGQAGRWHQERLHLSPFLYQTKEDGTRQWNADYRQGGHYYDPLYADKVIRFGVMKLPQPRKHNIPPGK
ncbi:MAG TPA: hypothetical protein DCE55_13080 [Planctomycetaceae bacterium]|nr:hypothetical protein [Planctomycetaceae bacterium]